MSIVSPQASVSFNYLNINETQSSENIKPMMTISMNSKFYI